MSATFSSALQMLFLQGSLLLFGLSANSECMYGVGPNMGEAERRRLKKH